MFFSLGKDRSDGPVDGCRVADFFLANVDVESGDNITHLKLQKLLYYAQGFHVAMHEGAPLFPESVLAWPHGPVVRQVWQRHKRCGFSPIAAPKNYAPENYAPEVLELLEAVNSIYGGFMPKRLEEMTHEESPWRNTPRNHVIRLELLQEYFGEIVEAGKHGEAIGGAPRLAGKRFSSSTTEGNLGQDGGSPRKAPGDRSEECAQPKVSTVQATDTANREDAANGAFFCWSGTSRTHRRWSIGAKGSPRRSY